MDATKTIVLLDGSDVPYLAGAIARSGGRVLPAPITRWGRGEWDARTYSDHRLAIVGRGLVGSDRRDVTADLPAILAALTEYASDDEIAETITALGDAFPGLVAHA
jgi:hypothetical protein